MKGVEPHFQTYKHCTINVYKINSHLLICCQNDWILCLFEKLNIIKSSLYPYM